ncbi:Flavorubredoxin [Caloramator quimbayensis]|uniref:Flavorubredoxin n=1 Tax=Caloramator quimbayensis TaxID=1147123 RepID=A0A1T4XIW6_9CLOT|nr:FprA family A-type flavoprotein [Caloramator quimbayensis]SKA89490.1 Flavorubredoxin [Caloramator quimbayensis]
MNIKELKKDVYYVGVKNPELRVFDIIMETKSGTTYNSYLIVDEKIVLIDCAKDGYFDEFISNIKSIIGDRQIDYVVVNHTEPDHSGCLGKILETYTDAVVYASKSALINIRQIINKDFIGEEAKGELSIGKRTLKFISAPFLHWPDTIFTYSEYDNILFSCDAFGCHYCDNSIFNDEVGDFSEEFKYYFEVIMGPFKKHVLSAIEKIKPLKIDIIAPSHGPIHRNNPLKYVALYENWSKPVLNLAAGKNASVLYVSAYGYTKMIAQSIAEGLKEAGAEVKTIDVSEMDINRVIDIIDDSKFIAVGSPTINQDALKPIWDMLSLTSPIINRGKLAFVFGSYGWSGEAVPMIEERLKGLKFKIFEEGFKVQFKPTKEDLEKAKNIGKRAGEAI